MFVARLSIREPVAPVTSRVTPIEPRKIKVARREYEVGSSLTASARCSASGVVAVMTFRRQSAGGQACFFPTSISNAMQEAEEPLRPPKKAKSQQLNGQNATKLLQMPKKSRARRLFAPFRALGIVSNGTPFAVQTRGGKGSTKTAVNVVTSLGRAWAMWDAAASLNLLFVGRRH